MATKAQERAALVKIRKIVDELGGDNSYIGMAFCGVWDIAEDNIANDFGRSATDYMLKCEGLEQKVQEQKQEVQEMKHRAEKAEDMVNKAQDRIDTWIARYHDADDAANENGRIAREAQNRVAELEDEIIRLKAKLYDMMVGA